MMSQEGWLSEYDRVAPTLVAHGEALRGELAHWLSLEPALKVHSVTMRLKARGSLARKLSRPDRTYGRLWDVTDVIGLRVITYFEDGVDRVGELVEARLPVDFVHSVDKRSDRSSFGYRSLHYVCRLPEIPGDVRCEIQVRTMLEHAWAEIEHDLGYKSEEVVPAVVRRRLQRLAGLLELADQEFGSIRRELDVYARDLPTRMAEAGEAIPLDRLSLEALLACEEAETLDRDVAAELGKELGSEPFFPDYLLKMLSAGGIHTVAAAREGLTRHRAVIRSMVKPYFAFASRTWSLSPEKMDRVFRGYGLFFLAHVAVLGAPALGINKVERLTHLYRELDYPDDVESAQHVASRLVDAFRDVG
ncbi:MAG: GTP pyrophosphokinase family protein [Polyangiaceae bacterium]|nr:GTP pyrophosphokinase family protein [Polyangiaceae bacterium]